MIKFLLISYLFYVITYFIYSTYVHRHLTHKSIEYSPGMVKFIKIWVWLGKPDYKAEFDLNWTAKHTHHHPNADTDDDIHSPFYGYYFPKYKARPQRQEMVDKVKDDPRLQTGKLDEWLEAHKGGFWYTAIILTLLFQFQGLVIALIMRYGQYISATLNDYGHRWPGYNHKPQTQGTARNYYPYGTLFQLGEELHGNHHNWPGRANFAVKWYEVDVCYQILRVLEKCKLVKIKPIKEIDESKLETFYEPLLPPDDKTEGQW